MLFLSTSRKRIHKASLINSLNEFNLPQKLIRLINISITESFIKVNVGRAETEPILIKSGLRQGDSISPFLFNLIIEKIVRNGYPVARLF